MIYADDGRSIWKMRENGNNDDIPFPHQHPPANATRRTKSNRERERANNQMFDLSNGWRVCFICVLSVAFPKFGQRSTARPSVCRICYGRQNTQHTHESNHNIVAIYTQGNQNTTKQKAMGLGSGQFNRLIDLRDLIALFTAWPAMRQRQMMKEYV